jgi:pyruvate/2-oxoglutarate dehydrogenase complex dihydrolipoamide acyltransferase (E2) component
MHGTFARSAHPCRLPHPPPPRCRPTRQPAWVRRHHAPANATATPASASRRAAARTQAAAARAARRRSAANCAAPRVNPRDKRLRESHKCGTIFVSLGHVVYPGSSQELQSPESGGRNSRDMERKVLAAAPVCAFHGLVTPATAVRRQKNGRSLERDLEVNRKSCGKPLVHIQKSIPHLWDSRRCVPPGVFPWACSPGVFSVPRQSLPR